MWPLSTGLRLVSENSVQREEWGEVVKRGEAVVTKTSASENLEFNLLLAGDALEGAGLWRREGDAQVFYKIKWLGMWLSG